MTRNVYVGTDVDNVLAAQSADEIPVLVAEAFQGLLATDFHERARLLAREVAWTGPHLIGLQEISTIRLQSPGDAIAGGTEPAQTVLFDYLDILLEALTARGLRYRPVAVIQNADVEVPMLTSVDPLSFDDVRLTDFDVILARNDVKTSDAFGMNYQARLTIPFGPGLTIEIRRGVVGVRAKIDGQSYRFVNTHLEPAPIPDLLPIQLAQAEELLSILDAEPDPTVLVGDLNTPAPSGETYQLIAARGYNDVWLERSGPPDDGATCCHAADRASLRRQRRAARARVDPGALVVPQSP
jgi:Endonuclease/Exonuclease/phosphatase family